MGARAQVKKTSRPLRMLSEPRNAAVFSQTCPIEVRNRRADVRWEGSGKWRRLMSMPGTHRFGSNRGPLQTGIDIIRPARQFANANLRRLANRLSLDAVEEPARRRPSTSRIQTST
jgi:hypothetical protein